MISAADHPMAAIRERLHAYGIAMELTAPGPASGAAGPDAIATLSRGGVVERYVVVAKSPITLSSISRAQVASRPHPLLVIGDRISRRSAAALRAAGVQFVDALGNAFITFDGVLIDVEGRTGPAGARDVKGGGRPAQHQQPTNIFSPRRSQVILALLAWPELSNARIRAIAEAAGVSTGQAHNAIGLLEQAGFLTRTARRLDRADELLDHWTAAYPIGLGRGLEFARFHGDLSRHMHHSHAGQPIYLSSESAEGTGIARPATLTVYIDSFDPRLPIVNRWSSSPERVPNVFVRRKFWSSPEPYEQGPPSARTRNAPWPMVYADLIATADARLSEVAADWRARHARPDEV